MEIFADNLIFIGLSLGLIGNTMIIIGYKISNQTDKYTIKI